MDDIPEDFFVTEEYVKFTEEIDTGVTQEFLALSSACTDYDLTGQVLWPAAKALSKYLSKNADLVRGKVVLELGAGSGFLGLFVSKLGAKVILSDGNDIVVRLLERNKEFGEDVEVCKVDWDDQEPSTALTEKGLPGTYQLVLGADVVYWANSVTPLFRCLDKLLAPEGVFIMCYTLRANNVYKILLEESRAQGFSYEVLFQELNTYIFAFRKASN